jgi:probable phosphoglycerate mutase
MLVVMPVTRIVLVRHGESACNIAGVVGGHLGCTGLSSRGRTQAEALRDRLLETGELSGATALYSSVLQRAIETAAIISPAVGGGSLEAFQTCSLCELHPGEGDGITWQEFRERYGEPDWTLNPKIAMAPGGESWPEMVQRVTEAINEIADRHKGELVVIACHGGVVEASMVSLLSLPKPEVPAGFPTAYTSITEWENIDGSESPIGPKFESSRSWRLVRYNDVAHLGGPFESQKGGSHRPLFAPEPEVSAAD